MLEGEIVYCIRPIGALRENEAYKVDKIYYKNLEPIVVVDGNEYKAMRFSPVQPKFKLNEYVYVNVDKLSEGYDKEKFTGRYQIRDKVYYPTQDAVLYAARSEAGITFLANEEYLMPAPQSSSREVKVILPEYHKPKPSELAVYDTVEGKPKYLTIEDVLWLYHK